MEFSHRKAETKWSEPNPTTWPVGQVVKTAASHAAIRSSTLLRVTKLCKRWGTKTLDSILGRQSRLAARLFAKVPFLLDKAK